MSRKHFFDVTLLFFQNTIKNLISALFKQAYFFLKLTTGILFFLNVSSCNSESGSEEENDELYFMASYDGEFTDAGTFALQTSDSGFVVVGMTSTRAVGHRSLLVLKTDKYGNPEWAAGYGTDSTECAGSVIETANHDYVICGHSSLQGETDHDVIFMRISNSGELLWSKMIGGSDYDYGTDVLELPDGSLILHGYSYSYGSGADDLFLSKFTAGGDSIWTKIYGGQLNEHGYSVEHTADNGFIMTGFTKSFNNEFYSDSVLLRSQLTPEEHYYDVYIIKTDSLGDTLWTRTMGKEHHDRGQYICETKDGSFVIAGHSYSFGDGCDVLLLKVSSDGNLLWSKAYSNPYIDASYSVCLLADGGFLIAGETAYMSDTIIQVAGLLIRTDANGDTLFTKVVPTRGGNTVLYYAGQTLTEGYFAVGKTIPALGSAFAPVLLSLDKNGNTLDKLPSANLVVKNVNLDVHYTTTIVGAGFDYKNHTLRQTAADCDVHFFKSEADSLNQWRTTFK